MHKSKGNAIWFDDAVEKIGADPMRLLYCLQDPSQELRFGFNVVKEPTNNLNIFYNISKLIEKSEKQKRLELEDKWILSKLHSLIEYVTENLENFHLYLAVRALQNFWLNDFSRGYIQMIRDRLSENDSAAKSILAEVYITLLKLAAPIVPFLTEKTWQNLKEKGIVSEESVHLNDWPKAEKKKINKKLEKDFETAMKIIEAGLAERDKIQIGLKWPLAEAEIKCDFSLGKEVYGIIERQLNVKNLKFKKEKELSVKLDTEMTPELEAEGYAREMSRQVQAFRKELGLNKNDEIELVIIADDELKKMLENFKKFIMERTNSKKLNFYLKMLQLTRKDLKRILNLKLKIKEGR